MFKMSLQPTSWAEALQSSLYSVPTLFFQGVASEAGGLGADIVSSAGIPFNVLSNYFGTGMQYLAGNPTTQAVVGWTVTIGVTALIGLGLFKTGGFLAGIG
jgi:hypothetical protein